MNENLHIFASVVELVSLNKASKALNLSQPALSRKIGKLEEELGVQLFERRGKKLVLTSVGHICYEYALEMRQLQYKFMQSIAEYKTKETGSITIGASLTTLQSTLPDLIAMFTNESPHIDIKAVTGKTHEIVTMVKDKKVDVGLVASAIEQPGLRCDPLFDDHLSLVVPDHHPLVDKSSVKIGDLHELPMILFSKGTWYRILMDELFHRYAVRPNVKMEIDSFEAILRLVSSCHTATLLPKSYLRHNVLEDSQLTILNITELKQTTRTTSLVYGDASSMNVFTQQLIDKARRFFRNGKS